MQVTKGGCVGKTCALAKLNDSSGGKRSKRLSKEERKGMVETFVKRHQASNNGSFPSLHLTHKEVGGSYYTVREIFRELIQENRVLAPPKLSPGEHNMEKLDSFLESHPLGSILFDPNAHGLPPKDDQTLLKEYEFRREKVFNSKTIPELHRQNIDNKDIINGSICRAIENEEVKDPRDRELLVKSEIDEEQMHIEASIGSGYKEQRNEGIKLEPRASLSREDIEEPKDTNSLLEGQMDEVKEVELHQDQIHHLSEVVVETFPLRPVSSTIDIVDEIMSEKEVLNGDLETGKDETSLFGNPNEVVDTKLVEELVTPVQESSDENNVLEDRASSTSTGINSQHLDSKSSSSSLQHSNFEENTANKNKSDIQPCGNAQKQAVDATLNKINTESGEAAASKQSDSPETNPIVSFIKTFVAVFVKFWSE